MGVEAKKMTKAITAGSPDDSLGARVASWPEKIKSFYNDVRTEMRKVTAPSRKEVQATTSVVLIAVFLFGVYFWVIDNAIARGVDYLFRLFTK